MIKITKNKNIIKVTGHANYAQAGEDIVCASASSIIYTTINALLNYNQECIIFKDEKDMMITVLKEDAIIKLLINNMLDLLEDLTKQYPHNVKIDKGE